MALIMHFFSHKNCDYVSLVTEKYNYSLFVYHKITIIDTIEMHLLKNNCFI